jgi:thiol-disulfide isomerase/thioredoxin
MASAQSFNTEKKMPEFEMVTTAGKHLTMKNLRGKVVLFDFWATWCGPCKAASPAMQKLYETFRSKGLMVIGADGMENEPGPGGAIAYAKAHHYSYTFTYGNDILEGHLGIRSIPAFALVDKHGVIRNAQVGLPPGGPAAIYAYYSPLVKKLLAAK